MAQKLLQPTGALEEHLVTGNDLNLSKSVCKERIKRIWSGSEIITTNRAAGGGLVTGKKLELKESVCKEKIRRLWSESEVITTNPSAGRGLVIGEK